MSELEVVDDPLAEDVLAELRALAPVIADALATLATLKARRLELWVAARDLGIQQKEIAKASGLTPTAVSQKLISYDSQGE
ncbi:MAG TPA: hypothetical protein VF244_10995 [Acidimicrobiales bacterium]